MKWKEIWKNFMNSRVNRNIGDHLAIIGHIFTEIFCKTIGIYAQFRKKNLYCDAIPT